jgi:hypothetical protein
MAAEVFISYAHDDAAFAKRLAHGLAREGVTGFHDQADIAAGAPWGDAVRTALATSKSLVLILSRRALDSNYVLAELGAADALGKPIIAVKFPDEPLPNPLPPVIDRRQILRTDGLSEGEIAAKVRRQIGGCSARP